MPEWRIEKLNNLLKEEISKILEREIEFPIGTIVTVTRVDISPDKQYAAVFVSLLGSEPAGALGILSKKIYVIQQVLNKKVRMRPVPKIHFAMDEEELRRESVERSISKLKQKGEI